MILTSEGRLLGNSEPKHNLCCNSHLAPQQGDGAGAEMGKSLVLIMYIEHEVLCTEYNYVHFKCVQDGFHF